MKLSVGLLSPWRIAVLLTIAISCIILQLKVEKFEVFTQAATAFQKRRSSSSNSSTPATATRRVSGLLKRPFILPEFKRLNLSDALHRSQELIQVKVRGTSDTLSEKTLDLIDNYNISDAFVGGESNTLKVAILTILSIDEDMMLDKISGYSLRRTGYAQLAKLVFAETLERSINSNASSRSTNSMDVAVHAIFDTTDYIRELHAVNRTLYPTDITYRLTPEQKTGCDEIHYDRHCQCIPPNSKANLTYDCGLSNCTEIPLTVDKRWTKVASLMYWSSYFDVIIVTDDDTWPGALIAPIQRGLEYAASSNSSDNNDSTFLWLPIDFGRLLQTFEFSNFAFMIDVRSKRLGGEFLRNWWESRLTPATFGDQGGMFRAILPFLQQQVLQNHPDLQPCFQKLELCNTHNLLSACVESTGLLRGDTQNWTVSFTPNLNFSRNQNMGFFGDSRTTKHTCDYLLHYLWLQRTFLHLRPDWPLNDVPIGPNSTGTQSWAMQSFPNIVHSFFDQFIDSMRSLGE